MVSKKSPAAMDLIIAQLKNDKTISYADVKKAAEKKKLVIYPIMYGRAKALLGLVPVAVRGSKKKTVTKRSPGRPRKVSGRGPGRPRKTAGRSRVAGAASPLDTLQAVVSGLRDQEKANTDLRRTLERIRDLIEHAL